MRILIFGATGQIGRLLLPKLLEDGHQLTALVRNAGAAEDLATQGVHLAAGDLEQSFDDIVGKGFDAAIFTAGSGASTGKDKTLTVDLWGAVQAVRYCERHGTARFIMISALKAQDPNQGKDAIKPYLAAKHAADEILKASDLAYTILRPGRLSDEAGSGEIRAAARLDDFDGEISRANVAECIRQCLTESSTERQTIDLLDGETPVAEALRRAE
ncbi:MAG TPA: SDR family oxidoreductase [Opitutales bacterium]|nr:SDR family oxidoreductase [Opitutales bacterium]